MHPQAHILDFPHVRIGIVTALKEEYAACKRIFDPAGNGIEREKQATSGQLNCYICSVPSNHGGNHIVAITLTAVTGNTAAAVAANILMQHCPIKSLIMCGIAGAVPHPAKPDDHVRLGDIVVSDGKGIIEYDFGKQRNTTKADDDPFAGFEFRGAPRPPCPNLLAVVKRIMADELNLKRTDDRDWEKKIDVSLQNAERGSPWKRPPSKKDQLIDTHDGTGEPTKHPRDVGRRSTGPRVFLGPIGAANIVLADVRKRNALRDRHGIKAVEMEGYGIAEASWIAGIGYLVVRGICDYCNATKNDVWHQYAALVAAAFTRTVVECMHTGESSIPHLAPSTVPTTPSVTSVQLDGGLATATTGERVVEVRDVAPNPAAIPVATVVTDPRVATESPPISATIDSMKVPSDFAAPSISQLRSLVEQVKILLKDNPPMNIIEPREKELENIIRPMPRQGADVREAWILLGEIEKRRQLIAKLSGKAPDITRMMQLRQEAENVRD